ncbi:uncharacterized protein LOC119687631 isoform X2 [Teleopsis dalmanni]|uniref:uncharacterized protein LOC119687631 isoform X2 n=1 Tax=Teleopsis dalmanni TaxID=139649 RepID=UPI0018CD3E12|nr:uncharacterized protein LOC119687631 isoform X2 [Teleopsis dalmanni]
MSHHNNNNRHAQWHTHVVNANQSTANLFTGGHMVGNMVEPSGYVGGGNFGNNSAVPTYDNSSGVGYGQQPIGNYHLQMQHGYNNYNNGYNYVMPQAPPNPVTQTNVTSTQNYYPNYTHQLNQAINPPTIPTVPHHTTSILNNIQTHSMPASDLNMQNAEDIVPTVAELYKQHPIIPAMPNTTIQATTTLLNPATAALSSNIAAAVTPAATVPASVAPVTNYMQPTVNSMDSAVQFIQTIPTTNATATNLLASATNLIAPSISTNASASSLIQSAIVPTLASGLTPESTSTLIIEPAPVSADTSMNPLTGSIVPSTTSMVATTIKEVPSPAPSTAIIAPALAPATTVIVPATTIIAPATTSELFAQADMNLPVTTTTVSVGTDVTTANSAHAITSTESYNAAASTIANTATTTIFATEIPAISTIAAATETKPIITSSSLIGASTSSSHIFTGPGSSNKKTINFPRRKLQTEKSDTLPICQRCKAIFFKKQIFVKHIAQSSCKMLEFDIKCGICPMSFMSNEELQNHEKLHKTNKFFCQKYCGKYFDEIEACENHEYTQHEYMTFVCNVCSATYGVREHFLAHLAQHKNQKRFDCPVCRLSFSLPQELYEHRLGEPFFCGKYYDGSSCFDIKKSNDPMPNYSPDTYNLNTLEEPSTSSQVLLNNSMKKPNFNQEHKIISTGSGIVDNILESFHMQTSQTIKMEIDPDNDYFNTHNIPFNTEQSMSSYTNKFSVEALNVYSSHQNSEAIGENENSFCCVPKCGVSKSTSPSLQFFPFPKTEKYLLQWFHNLRMDFKSQVKCRTYRICSLHFPKRCINRYSLCYWAVPTFNLGHDNVANLYQNREVTKIYTSGPNAQCSMPECENTRGVCNLKFYNFPTHTNILIKWCQNARLPVNAREPRHFCGKHFEDHCFGKFRLKPWAVPTLHLGNQFGRIHDNPVVTNVEEKKCCLPHCKRTRSSNLSLYRFPRDHGMLERWCYNLGLDAEAYRGKNQKICSMHFVKEALGLRKLTSGAVPTENLGHNDKKELYKCETYIPPAPPPPPAAPIVKPLPEAAIAPHPYQFINENSQPSPPNDETCPTSSSSLYDVADICLVHSCKNTRKTKSITLHTIPRRLEQRRKWLHNLRLSSKQIHKGMRICSVHFEPYCIGGCMRPFAVPTLKLGHNDTNIYRNPKVIKKLNIRETCCVETCKRNRDRDHANLHRFPWNLPQLQKWCENLHKPVPDGIKLFNDAICEVHFEARCLRGKRLEKWSIPTLKLGHNDVVTHQLPSDVEIAEQWPKISVPNVNVEEGECCVETCKRNPAVDDIKLYRTPDQDEVIQKWSHNLQIDLSELRNMLICNLHFESICIGKRRLFPWAIPTLNFTRKVEQIYENPVDRMEFLHKHKAIKVVKAKKATPWTPRCCLSHCRKMRATDNVQLYRFPHLNRNMLAKWCHNLQLPLTGNNHRRLCSTHFEPEVLTKKCPMVMSVPTIDLNTPPGYKIYQNPARLKYAKMRLQVVCIIPTCRQTREDGVQLFRFPHSRRALLRKWCHNTRQKASDAVKGHYRVCSKHFESHSFGSKRLCPGAIPTLHLGHDDTDIFGNEAEATQIITTEERPNEIVLKCCVPTCGKSRKYDEVQLNSFPKNIRSFKQWKYNLKLDYLDFKERAKYKICNDHFEDICLGKLRLRIGALPTKNLGHNNLDDIFQVNPKELQYNQFSKPLLDRYDELDATETDANELDANELDTNELDANELDTNEIDTNEIDTNELDRSETDTNELDGTELDTNESDRTELDTNESDKSELNRTELNTTELDRIESTAVIDDDSNIAISELANMYANEEPTEELIVPDNTILSEQLEKCAYPACKASKTLLKETFSLPKNEQLLNMWCTHMHIDQDTLNTDQLCGLHYIELYQSTIAAMNELHSDESNLKFELQVLAHYYNRCSNSLIVCSAQCSVSGCSINQLNHAEKLFQFPYSRELIKKWVFNTGIEIDENRRYLHKVCSQHFEPYCLTETHRLRPWAIPTLNLQHPEPDKMYKNPDLIAIERRLLGPVALKCCVSSCQLERNDDGLLKFFNFPHDGELLQIWVENLKLEKEKSPLYKICEQHFEKHCFGNARLRAWAIPTINLGHDDPNIHQNPVTNTNTENEATDMAHAKMKNSLDMVKCCVVTCQKCRLKHGVQLFGFPNSIIMQKKWAHNLCMPHSAVNKQVRICSLHFHRRCIDEKHLRSWAVPTLHLGHGNSIFENPKNIPGFFLPLCRLSHCGNRRTLDNNLRTFAFPKNPEMLQKWSINLKLTISDCRGRLCAEHFEAEVMGNRKLRNGAVPTLNLGHDDELAYTNYALIQSIKQNGANLMDSLDFDVSEVMQFSTTQADTSGEVDTTGSELHNTDAESTHYRATMDTYSDDYGAYDDEHHYTSNDEQNISTTMPKNDNFTDGSYENYGTKTVHAQNSTNGLNTSGNNIFANPNNTSSSNAASENNDNLRSKFSRRSVNNISPICCLLHCGKQKTPEQHLTTFGFPKDKNLLLKWCENLKLDPENCIGRVCIDHFELRMIGKRKLKAGAVPTLNLGHNDPIKHTNFGSNEQHNIAVNRAIALSVPASLTQSMEDDVDNSDPSFSLQCCLKHCKRKKTNETLLYHFPNDEVCKKKWYHNLQMGAHEYKSDMRVCGKHFVPCLKMGPVLKDGTVPTIDLGHTSKRIYKNYRAGINNTVQTGNVCCMPHCENAYKVSSVNLFPFPNPRMLQARKWCQNTRLPMNYIQRHICANHFDNNAIVDGKLHPSALPTLNLNHNNPIFPSPIPVEENTKHTTEVKTKEVNNTKKLLRADGKGSKFCCVEACISRLENKNNVIYYKFPTNEKLLRKWCHNLEMKTFKPNIKKLLICELHFKPYCLGKRLRSWAVPTVYLNRSKEGTSIYHNPRSEVLFHTCCIKTCGQVRDKEAGIRLFTFPTRDKLFQKWVHNVHKDEATCRIARICNLHFESKCIGKTLAKWAIPTLDLGHNDDHIFKNTKTDSDSEKSVSSESDQQINECCIPSCESNPTPEQLFTFPKTAWLYTKWCENINLPDEELGNKKLCVAHFEDYAMGRNRPQPWALPTLNLGHNVIMHQNPTQVARRTSEDSESSEEKHCAISTCKKPKTEDVQFFKYPSKVNLMRKWAENCNHNADEAARKGYRICSNHFDPKSIKGKRLLRGSLPTLNLGHNREKIHRDKWCDSRLKPEQLKKFNCNAPNCGRNKINDQVKLCKFPRDNEMRNKWCTNLKLNPDACENLKICEVHFEERCIQHERLLKLAVPTLHLGHNDENIIPNPTSFKKPEAIIRCCVTSCGNIKSNNQNIMFSAFPKLRSLFIKWTRNLQLQPTSEVWQNYKICSKHFEPQRYKHNRLIFGSVPTLHLGHTDSPVYSPEQIIKRKHRPFPGRASHLHNRFEKKCCFPECNNMHYYKFEEMYDVPNDSGLYVSWCRTLRVNPHHVSSKLKVCPIHFKFAYMKNIEVLEKLKTKCMPDDDVVNEIVKKLRSNIEEVNQNKIVRGFICSVPECGSCSLTSEVKLYTFPRREYLIKHWCLKTKVSYDAKMANALKICEQHFENVQMRTTANNSKKLKSWAIPTLKLPENEYSNKSVTILLGGLTHKLANQPLHSIKRRYFTKNKLKILRPIRTKEKHSNNSNESDNNIDTTELIQEADSLIEYSAKFCKTIEARNSVIKLLTNKLKTGNSTATVGENEGFKIRVVPYHKLCQKLYEDAHDAQNDHAESVKSDDHDKSDDDDSTTNGMIAEDIDSDNSDMPLEYLRNKTSAAITRKKALKRNTLTREPSVEQIASNEMLMPLGVGGITRTSTDSNAQIDEKPCINLIDDTQMLDDTAKSTSSSQAVQIKSELADTSYNEDSYYADVSASQCENTINDDRVITQTSNTSSTDFYNEGEVEHCWVEGCTSVDGQENIALFSFPTSGGQFRKWQNNACIKADLKLKKFFRICNLHFEPKYIQNGRELLSGSVPTLNLNAQKKQIDSNCAAASSETNKTANLIRNPAANSTNTTCSIQTCRRRLGEDGVELFKLPENPILSAKWLRNCRLDVHVRGYNVNICSLHFDSTCFDDMHRLKFGSLPTLYVGPKNCNNAPAAAADGIFCCVPSCRLSYNNSRNLRLFKFPQNERSLREWLQVLPFDYDPKRAAIYFVCEQHFDMYSFDANKDLIETAVPTLNLDARHDLVPDLKIEIEDTQISDYSAPSHVHK